MACSSPLCEAGVFYIHLCLCTLHVLSFVVEFWYYWIIRGPFSCYFYTCYFTFHLSRSCLLCILWHIVTHLIWLVAFQLVYNWDQIVLLLLCFCDNVNFCSVYHYCSCLFATVLFIPWIPVYFQATGCCLVVIKRSLSMKVLLFWRRTEF